MISHLNKYLVSTAFFSLFICHGQELEDIRNIFHQPGESEKLERIIAFQPDISGNTELAYVGIAEAMMAQYVFFPFTKYNYFQRGIKKIESSISQERNVENIYLRLLIQLNAPPFLGYSKDIQDDIDYICANFESDRAPLKWKLQFVETLLLFEYDNISFYGLRKIKSNYSEQ